MSAGRPPKFNTTEEMQRVIDLYFLACKVHQTGDTDLLKALSDEDLALVDGIDDIYPTVTGLGLALDMSRKTLVQYENSDKFSNTVKRAKQRVENAIEQRLFYNNATGSIFNLKNNFDWKDQQDVSQRYVNKDGEDLSTEDLKIINDYKAKIKEETND